MEIAELVNLCEKESIDCLKQVIYSKLKDDSIRRVDLYMCLHAFFQHEQKLKRALKVSKSIILCEHCGEGFESYDAFEVHESICRCIEEGKTNVS